MSRVAGVAVDTLVAAAVAAGVALLLGHAFPDYDALWTLLWGDDLANGRDPQLELPFAPASHPLYVAIAAALAPLGDDSADALRWIVLLSTGAFVVGVFRLGQVLFSWPVGLVAAVILVTRVPTLYFGSSAFVDLPAVALVTWAAVLEARHRRRGGPVLVLLALAGLLRPELWLMAGAYWLWLAPALDWPARARAAAVVALGPALWALSELVVTGDPLRPLTRKNAELEEVGSTSGLVEAPGELASDIGGFLQAPALVLAAVGLAVALVWLPRRAALPVAIGTLNVATFALLAATDQPLEQRYLFLAASMAALLAAVAALGWTALDREHPWRNRWRAAGLVALAAAVAVSAPRDVDRARDLRADVRLGAELQRDLRDLLQDAREAGVLDRGARVYLPTARLVPFVAFWTDRRPSTVGSPAPSEPAPGRLILPNTAPAAQLLTRGIPDADGDAPPAPSPPPGWTRLADRSPWTIYAAR